MYNVIGNIHADFVNYMVNPFGLQCMSNKHDDDAGIAQNRLPGTILVAFCVLITTRYNLSLPLMTRYQLFRCYCIRHLLRLDYYQTQNIPWQCQFNLKDCAQAVG